jgi:starvation-inducible DNA-binding protein
MPAALEIARELVQRYEAVARTIRSVFLLADEANDQPLADLLTQRLQIHERIARMMRSPMEA